MVRSTILYETIWCVEGKLKLTTAYIFHNRYIHAVLDYNMIRVALQTNEQIIFFNRVKNISINKSCSATESTEHINEQMMFSKRVTNMSTNKSFE